MIWNLLVILMFAFVTAANPLQADPIAVTTYHYDNLRTGWNPRETTLTPEAIPKMLDILKIVPLDAQVDAQPLIVPSQNIAAGSHPGTYEVVYVVTEANTVYAINSANGAVLLTRNLGPAVTNACLNNAPIVGITSTPVINVAKQTLFAMAYVLENDAPTYKLFALNLSDLSDKTAPVVVRASHKLINGATFDFDATHQRQRAALIEASGAIYAAFASFCDFSGPQSRGWLLGWNEDNLTPLALGLLTNSLVTEPGPFWLSSIWMSGFGVAADASGVLYFSTGNTTYPTHDVGTNISNSVVKMSGTLASPPLGIFTPSNVADLDQSDHDLSGGGVMLLPPQPGSHPNLAVAAGKSGMLYLLDRDDLGGYQEGPNGTDRILASESLGPGSFCLCGPSYFVGSDGIGRVVTSGSGHNDVITHDVENDVARIQTWKLRVPIANSPLELEGLYKVSSGQEGGTFTIVTSDGTVAGSSVIWAIGRPIETRGTVSLYAMHAAPTQDGKLPLLFQREVGFWPNLSANANLVPVVANGKVYVATNKQLTILGLNLCKPIKDSIKKIQLEISRDQDAADDPTCGASCRKTLMHEITILESKEAHEEDALRTCEAEHGSTPTVAMTPTIPSHEEIEAEKRIIRAAPNMATGVLLETNGLALSLRTRKGERLEIDGSQAAQLLQIGVLLAGKAYTAQGKFDSKGVLHASSVARAKDSEETWPPDR